MANKYKQAWAHERRTSKASSGSLTDCAVQESAATGGQEEDLRARVEVDGFCGWSPLKCNGDGQGQAELGATTAQSAPRRIIWGHSGCGGQIGVTMLVEHICCVYCTGKAQQTGDEAPE